MSARHNVSSTRVPQSPTPEAERSNSDTSSLDEAVYKCGCGTPDMSGNWICCDNDACPVGWYHWECVQVTEEPSGDWLCPRCNLDSTEKAECAWGAKTSTSPKAGKTAATGVKASPHREKPRGQPSATKTPLRAKKGTAVKKPAPKKGKSKWTGWVETASESEEENRKDAKTVGVAEGKQTKARVALSKEKTMTPPMRKECTEPATEVEKTARTVMGEKKMEKGIPVSAIRSTLPRLL